MCVVRSRIKFVFTPIGQFNLKVRQKKSQEEMNRSTALLLGASLSASVFSISVGLANLKSYHWKTKNNRVFCCTRRSERFGNREKKHELRSARSAVQSQNIRTCIKISSTLWFNLVD